MVRAFIVFSVFATTMGLTLAQSDSVKDKANLVELRTKKIIDNLKEAEKKENDHLQRAKKGVIDKKSKGVIMPANDKMPIRFPSKEEKEKTVQKTEDRLIEMKNQIKKYVEGTEFYYGILNYPPKIGDFGKIYSGDTIVNVKQVIDKNIMLINVYYTINATKIIGKPGNQTPISDFKTNKMILMVKGVSTKGATDGLAFDLPQIFEVIGTETYKNVLGGSNTVFVIEPIETKNIDAYLRNK